MAAIGEAIGMSLPGSASPPAVDRRRDDDAYAAGEAVMNLVRLGIRPRQIMTKEAFENAIAVTNALGGSTNAVLHLLAMANEAKVGDKVSIVESRPLSARKRWVVTSIVEKAKEI